MRREKVFDDAFRQRWDGQERIRFEYRLDDQSGLTCRSKRQRAITLLPNCYKAFREVTRDA